MAKPCECKKGERILLVEGKNDCHVIRMLWKEYKLPENQFCINECGGDENIFPELEIHIKADLQSRPKMIGIVLDADIPENKNLILRLGGSS